jgi:hypothetical protein
MKINIIFRYIAFFFISIYSDSNSNAQKMSSLLCVAIYMYNTIQYFSLQLNLFRFILFILKKKKIRGSIQYTKIVLFYYLPMYLSTVYNTYNMH